MKSNYEKGLVSVIMPAYNCEKYIKQAVESIENQTYHNIELIICDDCSSDETKNIILELAQKYSNIITLFNEQNLKIVKTKNRCLEVCNGEFITSQDADDFSERNKIKRQVDFLKENPEIDYVSCGMYKVNDKNDILGEIKFKERIIQDKDFIKGSPAAHAPTMFRRKTLENVGGYRYDEKASCIEDYDLFFRLQIAGNKGYLLSDLLYYYRQDEDFSKRRSYKYRIGEYRIRKKYYSKLNIKGIKRLYMFKPLIVGLIPSKILKKIKLLIGNKEM